MNPEDVAEKECWESLLACPGWQRLETTIRAHRAQQLEADLELATNDADDPHVLRRIQAISASRKAVEAIFALPRERLKLFQARQAETRTATHGYSRGGL